LYGGLKPLIDARSGNTEDRCREYLQYASALLFKDPWRVLSYVDPATVTEYRLHSGDSDYIVVAKIKDELDRESVRAYLWELKAPQCPMFVKETISRLCPSKYLYKAINQLLHFYSESEVSGTFRSAFGIVRQEDVRLGGIIIGCNRNKVPSSLSRTDAKILYSQVTYAWDCLFENKIRLLNWEKILDWIGPKETHKDEQYP
jgi:hypothetical protein